MNQAEVEKQIQQMVQFIRSEANEKAAEIRVKAEEEFNMEKLSLVQAEKTRIRKDYDRKNKALDAQRKIAYSQYLNECRLAEAKFKAEAVQEVVEACRMSLAQVAADRNKYKALLKGTLLQSLMKMMEPKVEAHIREEDKDIFSEVLAEVLTEYSQTMSMTCEVTISDHYLHPGPKDGNVGNSCCGGMILSAKDGKIRVENTLDSRLEIAISQSLPEIRDTLFKTHSASA
jgi:V-type H+-transporting ATPase subunit E